MDYDVEMCSAIRGFTYDEPLHFTAKDLKPLVKTIVENLGAAAGIERVENFAPDLIPESLVIDHYLAEQQNAAEEDGAPFVLIYKEYLPADEADVPM